MTRITWVQPDGSGQTFDVANGISVMEAARANNVAGIIAECGGGCACGTCKVLVEEAWAARVGGPNPLELSLIEDSDLSGNNLRLSCQITVIEALDGLVVHVPHCQR